MKILEIFKIGLGLYTYRANDISMYVSIVERYVKNVLLEKFCYF